jgi:hypothetical protein
LLRLILALIAIALTALPAVAADKLPTEMLGTWCLDEHEASTFRRGDCQDKTDSWLQVNADGYRGHEFGCKAIKVSVDVAIRDIRSMSWSRAAKAKPKPGPRLSTCGSASTTRW